MSIYAYFKLELLSIKSKRNHFALKSALCINALKSCFRELQNLKMNSQVNFA